MKEVIYANTGEVKSGGPNDVLNSGAIGSCVVIAAYDSIKNKGTMAHIMLPGKAPYENHPMPNRYAANAIEEIISQMAAETHAKNIEVCLVGGANVLKRKGDSIGNENLKSIVKLLNEKKITIKGSEVGGFERRTAIFDLERGTVYFTVGDSKQKILYHFVK